MPNFFAFWSTEKRRIFETYSELTIWQLTLTYWHNFSTYSHKVLLSHPVTSSLDKIPGPKTASIFSEAHFRPVTKISKPFKSNGLTLIDNSNTLVSFCLYRARASSQWDASEAINGRCFILKRRSSRRRDATPMLDHHRRFKRQGDPPENCHVRDGVRTERVFEGARLHVPLHEFLFRACGAATEWVYGVVWVGPWSEPSHIYEAR